MIKYIEINLKPNDKVLDNYARDKRPSNFSNTINKIIKVVAGCSLKTII